MTKMRCSLGAFLFFLPTIILAQGLNPAELSDQFDCKNGNAAACEALSASIKERVLQGAQIDISPGEMLFDECAAGIGSSCVRLRLLNARRQDQGQPVIDSSPGVDAPPVGAPILEPAAKAPTSDTTSSSIPGWVWLIAGLILGVGGVFWWATRPLPPEPERLITPALPIPKMRPGQRLPQGSIEGIGSDHQQLVAWDRSWINAWLDEQIEAARLKIEDDTCLKICDQLEFADANEYDANYAASVYLLDTYGDGDGGRYWTDVHWRYFNLQRARQDHVGGAYTLANVIWDRNIDFDPRVIVHLFRLDADKDFNPSAVNLSAVMAGKGLEYTPEMITVPEMEMYLRYFFLLGAPDGHYHITAQLLSFYLYDFGLRDDEGYVAAAVRRVQKLYNHQYRVWRDRIDAMSSPPDLSNKDIGENGMMYDQAEKEESTLQ